MKMGCGGTYLLTWTTYGTWLRGDPRGFVGPVRDSEDVWVTHNIVETPFDADVPALMDADAERAHGITVLGSRRATVVADTLREVALHHVLDLKIGAVMRTHAHVVVYSPFEEGTKLLQLCKGVSSRRLGQRCGSPAAGKWWARHGSRRLLTTQNSIERVIAYVRAHETALAWCGSEVNG